MRIEKRKHMIEFTFSQIGAFATLLVLAVWGNTVLGINLATLSGANDVEIISLGTVSSMFCILGPLYLRKIRWSYVTPACAARATNRRSLPLRNLKMSYTLRRDYGRYESLKRKKGKKRRKREKRRVEQRKQAKKR